MNKLRLHLEELAVESFDTSAGVREKGTVVGEEGPCTCPNVTCAASCPYTCAYTCDDATCPQCPTCAQSCNGTCEGVTCWETCVGASCWDSCPNGCN
jgi:hypothetical protein